MWKIMAILKAHLRWAGLQEQTAMREATSESIIGRASTVQSGEERTAEGSTA